jgi:hypothetical protein
MVQLTTMAYAERWFEVDVGVLAERGLAKGAETGWELEDYRRDGPYIRVERENADFCGCCACFSDLWRRCCGARGRRGGARRTGGVSTYVVGLVCGLMIALSVMLLLVLMVWSLDGFGAGGGTGSASANATVASAGEVGSGAVRAALAEVAGAPVVDNDFGSGE